MKNDFIKSVKLTASAILLAAIITTGCKKDKEDTLTPTAYTKAANFVGPGWAVLNGSVNPIGLTTQVTFEYDTTTSYKNSISADPGILSESTETNVSAVLTDLKPGTLYYFRIKAVNSTDSVYGSDLTLKTSVLSNTIIVFNQDLTYGSVTDFEGNEYKTIEIGSKTWMAENLRSTKLNDGEDIPFLLTHLSWIDTTSPGYSWYDSDSLSYGALYNWYTVNTSKLCPTGWHVPDDDEWAALIDNTGGEPTAGNSLKETGSTHWTILNSNATNESGFTAIPAGYRSYLAAFKSMGQKAYWWSATEFSSYNGNYVSLSYSYSNVDRSSSDKNSGFSVRCVKDN